MRSGPIWSGLSCWGAQELFPMSLCIRQPGLVSSRHYCLTAPPPAYLDVNPSPRNRGGQRQSRFPVVLVFKLLRVSHCSQALLRYWCRCFKTRVFFLLLRLNFRATLTIKHFWRPWEWGWPFPQHQPGGHCSVYTEATEHHMYGLNHAVYIKI